MKHFTLLLAIFLALVNFSCGSISPTENDRTDIPVYEVYVLMSASWASEEMGGLYRFMKGDNDEVKAKMREESPITFAYIRGNGVEMVFGTGARADTVFQIPKGSYDFVDQKTLLSNLGTDPENIKTVVIESTCFDHTGGIDFFTKAKFIIQKKEYDAMPTEYSDINDNEKIKKIDSEGRLEIIDGDKELYPGITAHFLGGHTKGTQFLSVNTKDGLVVLAGDGLYTYENLKYDIECPFKIGEGEQKKAYALIRKVLGDSDKLLVPGHDIEVFRRFPKITDRIVQVKL